LDNFCKTVHLNNARDFRYLIDFTGFFFAHSTFGFVRFQGVSEASL